MRRFLRALSTVCLFAGTLVLVGYGVLMWQIHSYEQEQRRQFDERLAARDANPPQQTNILPGDGTAGDSDAEPPSMDLPLPAPEPGSPSMGVPVVIPPGTMLGELEVPRLHVNTLILEGDDDKTLRHGAGHIPGTALPDSSLGNIGIAAHRDSYFRPLRHIQEKDVIVIHTLAGSYRYLVQSVRIVDPGDVGVLAGGTDGRVLTLVTCYPFNFIGSAPKRFVVQAAAIDQHPVQVRTLVRQALQPR